MTATVVLRAVSECTSERRSREPVTVVVPCFNEVEGLGQLVDRLRGLAATDHYDLRFIFVDDGSVDGTGEALDRVALAWERASVLHHEANLGITAAILTGIRHADTEAVGTIDSDCSYDPDLLLTMLPLLTPDVDLVTASPYHPAGRVANVPAWRLGLSRAASWMYRHVVRQRLYTYTSCCRIYRRSIVMELPEVHDGFQGVAEMLARIAQRGGTIVECPATLHARKFGRSKLRTLTCAMGHLSVLAHLAMEHCIAGFRRLLARRSKGPGEFVALTLPLTTPTAADWQQRTVA